MLVAMLQFILDPKTHAASREMDQCVLGAMSTRVVHHDLL